MKNAEGIAIYVGKAKSLRSRVASYFRASAVHGPKNQAMVDEVATVDCLETESEVDAFLLENRLIKDVQPRYNVRLKDDKSFPYLAITLREEFPRVLIGRENELAGLDAARFGPFTDVKGLRRALPILQRVFKFRTCALDIDSGDPKWRHYRPCLLASIDMCTAPCALRIASVEYRRSIDVFKRFLKGAKSSLVKALEREMLAASRDLEFERAASLRDQVKGLKSLGELGRYGEFLPGSLLARDPAEGLGELATALALRAPPRMIEGIDIATLQGGETVGSLVSFVDGVPCKDSYRRYRIKTVVGTDDFASIREVVSRRYRAGADDAPPRPDLVLIDGGLGQLGAAAAALDALGVTDLPLVSLAKREELVYRPGTSEPLRLARNSRALHVLQAVRDEAHRFAQHYHHVLRRKSQLGEGGNKPSRRRARRSAAP